MQDHEKIRQLFERYRQGECTPEELAQLHAWFNQYAHHEAHGFDDLGEMYKAEQFYKKKQWLHWLPYTAAAAMLLFALAWYFNDNTVENANPEMVKTSNDIRPGRNRATLFLAGGRAMDLSETESGIVIGHERILYEKGAEALVNLDADEATPLVLSTPKGGTYQITLSDGTKVWLNAASILKYPSRFTDTERVVEVEGEAYFSVAKDLNKPFRVVSRGQQIEVLGTEFNVSAYADESELKTTLVEGNVQLLINNGKCMLLMPNEQSVLSGSTISKQVVDIGPYIAWKDGNFNFDNTTLSDMMKQMSRWYDVDVIYESDVPKERFSGTMSRDVTLQTVLELLRISEITYRIQGNKLIIE